MSASRVETPVHPGMEVDGIKFMEVSDPTYKSSSVFNEYQKKSSKANLELSSQDSVAVLKKLQQKKKKHQGRAKGPKMAAMHIFIQ